MVHTAAQLKPAGILSCKLSAQPHAAVSFFSVSVQLLLQNCSSVFSTVFSL